MSMKKFGALFTSLLVVQILFFAPSFAKDTQSAGSTEVKGYTKKDGTVVKGYSRKKSAKTENATEAIATPPASEEVAPKRHKEPAKSQAATTTSNPPEKTSTKSNDSEVVHVKGYTRKDGKVVQGYTRKKSTSKTESK